MSNTYIVYLVLTVNCCFIFVAGESVAKYIREPSPFNTQIVSLGVDTYLKMLLADNFVHTDLHPGNIMVRIRGVSHHQPVNAAPLLAVQHIIRNE